MSIGRPTVEQVSAFAFKLAVFATVATILVLVVGGFHYLSTTNNFTQPGSLAILGYLRYPLVTAIGATLVGVATSLWSEHGVTRYRRARRENDDRPSTLDVIGDRNKRY